MLVAPDITQRTARTAAPVIGVLVFLVLAGGEAACDGVTAEPTQQEHAERELWIVLVVRLHYGFTSLEHILHGVKYPLSNERLESPFKLHSPLGDATQPAYKGSGSSETSAWAADVPCSFAAQASSSVSELLSWRTNPWRTARTLS